jgi:hypothetical protein
VGWGGEGRATPPTHWCDNACVTYRIQVMSIRSLHVLHYVFCLYGGNCVVLSTVQLCFFLFVCLREFLPNEHGSLMVSQMERSRRSDDVTAMHVYLPSCCS